MTPDKSTSEAERSRQNDKKQMKRERKASKRKHKDTQDCKTAANSDTSFGDMDNVSTNKSIHLEHEKIEQIHEMKSHSFSKIGENLNDEGDEEGTQGDKKKCTISEDLREKSKTKKRKKREIANADEENKLKNTSCIGKKKEKKYFPFEYDHILAPMVGASELAFRLLCRKYGATLAYTPMMSASQFIKEAATINDKSKSDRRTVANSNICEFQSIPQDRPLVCHFSSNNPEHFAQAAKLVAPYCDAIDLNLGCPQRTAFVGHFGSYLLGPEDRQLVLDIVRAGSQAVPLPIFVKIRLLDTVEETIKLCHQLRDAGASLIAVHARYRASWERTGPGARDGPALLDHISLIKHSMPDFPIISNGNVKTYEDVVANRELTLADGIMSAEGILDDPSLYLQRFGDIRKDGNKDIPVPNPFPMIDTDEKKSNASRDKMLKKLYKKLRKIEIIEKKAVRGIIVNEDEREKIKSKTKVLAKIQEWKNSKASMKEIKFLSTNESMTTFKLRDLAKTANNKLALAEEYLSLVRLYPTKIRSVVFHVRRMCKSLLERYQLMDECIASNSVDEVDTVLSKCARYMNQPDTFQYDHNKAMKDKEVLEHKRREEGKRKAYEARMVRKAKREGLKDLEHYLRIGLEVPSVTIIQQLKHLPKEDCLALWKKNHSQHCMAYHLEMGGCKRDRTCAFLHVDAKHENTFYEDDEVAG